DFIKQRYQGWDKAEGQAILSGSRSLEEVAARVTKDNLQPQPRSGKQEWLENVVNRYV
ncbi:xylose isomerase, partial [Tianweitania populi]